jgi:hypothetical protein
MGHTGGFFESNLGLERLGRVVEGTAEPSAAIVQFSYGRSPSL